VPGLEVFTSSGILRLSEDECLPTFRRSVIPPLSVSDSPRRTDVEDEGITTQSNILEYFETSFKKPHCEKLKSRSVTDFHEISCCRFAVNAGRI
jgi:hypothetical protein